MSKRCSVPNLDSGEHARCLRESTEDDDFPTTTTTKKKKTMDPAVFTSLLDALSEPSISSFDKAELFVEKTLSEKAVSTAQLGRSLGHILFVNYRLKCCTEVARAISDWDTNKATLKTYVKKWEFQDFVDAIEEKRGRKNEKNKNRTLAVLNNREGEDDADARLPSAVEEEFTPKLYENQSTEDPNWVKPINVYVPPRAKTDTKRIGMKYEHFDKKKNLLLVELQAERDVPESFKDEFNTIAYDEDFCGDIILDVKNDFKIKGGVKVSMKCNEFGHWVTGSGKNRRSHTKRRTSYSRELHLLSDDQNRTFRQGEKVVLPFKFDDIIDAPSFYYHCGNSTCYVKWEFSVYLDLDYGSAFGNAFGRDVDFKCDCNHVGKYLSVSDPVNAHLGVPTDKNISMSIPSFMCCCSSGDLEGRVWLERDHFSVADDVKKNKALRSALQMQLKNSSKKKEIQNARYEFRRSISIDRHCFDDCVVSSGYFPQSNLTPEMTNFENFNFQVSLVDEHGLSLANQATSPRTNYARLEWKLVIIFKVSYAFDPKIDFPITLCPRFIA